MIVDVRPCVGSPEHDLVAAGFELPPATFADEDESEEEGENVVAQDANIDF